MPVLMKIALRNLKEHKSKSLIIGVLIAMGILILTLGNSILVTASRGIEKTFIDSFTGHILVHAKAENPVTILGGGRGDDVAGQSIPEYSQLYDYVTSLPQVLAANPQITLRGTVDYSEEGEDRGAFINIFGVEPESYLDMFPDSLNILEGRFLESGERGIVLPKAAVDSIRDTLEEDIAVGDEVKIQTFGNSLKIRRLPVVGVHEYASAAGSVQTFAFIDAATARSIGGLVVGSADVVNIDAADSSLLDTGDDSSGGSLFSDEALFGDEGLFAEEDPLIATGEEDLFSILGDTSERAMASMPDAGAWSYLLIRLNSDAQTAATIEGLNTHFEQEGWPLAALDWQQASGNLSQISRAFQIFFYAVIIIIAVVSVIIIMNTLVISVIERTKEIGTMRSLGAHKKTVRRMFVSETMSISLVFGTIGLLLGLLLILICNLVGIRAPNLIIEDFFGEEILRPVLTFGTVFISYLVILGIGFISCLYPVRVALKIQPVEAMQSV